MPIDAGILDLDARRECHTVRRLRLRTERAVFEGIERCHEQRRAGSGHALEQVTTRLAIADARGLLEQDRPRVQALVDAEGSGSRLGVTRPDRVLHGCRAAPSREEREVEVDPPVHGDRERGRRQECAVGDNGTAVRCQVGEGRECIGVPQARGREDGQAEFIGAHVHGAGPWGTAPARGCRRAREHADDLVPRRGQSLQARQSHIGCAGEDQAHAVTATWQRRCGG